MTLSRALRWLLALTLLASIWVALQDEPEQTARKPPALAGASPERNRAVGSAAQALSWPQLHASGDTPDAAWPQPTGDARDGWQAPPAPRPAATPLPPPKRNPIEAAPPPAAPNPVPSAPSFPYKLIGQFEDQGQKFALLADSRSTIPVLRDQVIDRHWKVVAIDTAGLDVTWLPTGQTLKISY